MGGRRWMCALMLLVAVGEGSATRMVSVLGPKAVLAATHRHVSEVAEVGEVMQVSLMQSHFDSLYGQFIGTSARWHNSLGREARTHVAVGDDTAGTAVGGVGPVAVLKVKEATAETNAAKKLATEGATPEELEEAHVAEQVERDRKCENIAATFEDKPDPSFCAMVTQCFGHDKMKVLGKMAGVSAPCHYANHCWKPVSLVPYAQLYTCYVEPYMSVKENDGQVAESLELLQTSKTVAVQSGGPKTMVVDPEHPSTGVPRWCGQALGVTALMIILLAMLQSSGTIAADLLCPVLVDIGQRANVPLAFVGATILAWGSAANNIFVGISACVSAVENDSPEELQLHLGNLLGCALFTNSVAVPLLVLGCFQHPAGAAGGHRKERRMPWTLFRVNQAAMVTLGLLLLALAFVKVVSLFSACLILVVAAGFMLTQVWVSSATSQPRASASRPSVHNEADCAGGAPSGLEAGTGTVGTVGTVIAPIDPALVEAVLVTDNEGDEESSEEGYKRLRDSPRDEEANWMDSVPLYSTLARTCSCVDPLWKVLVPTADSLQAGGGLAIAQPFVVSLLFAVGLPTTRSSMVFTGSIPATCITLAVGLLCSAVVALKLRQLGPGAAPPRWLTAAYLSAGLVAANVLLNLLGLEIVGAIEMLQVITHLPDSVLGLTLLTWSSALPDLVVVLALAKAGHLAMAVNGAVGASVTEVGVGVGGAYLLYIILAGHSAPFALDPSIMVFIVALPLGAALTVLYLVCNSRRLGGGYAVLHFAFYAAVLVLALSLELRPAAPSV